MVKPFSAIVLCLALAASPAVLAQDFEVVDDLGNTVVVPEAPQRIVSLHDLIVTIPMIELGVTPVGSMARIGPDGSHFIRGAATLTGVDFSNSEITSIGAWPADIEAIAALEPDLIIRPTIDTTPLEQLQRIAPTVSIEDNMRGDFVSFEQIAELTGTTDRLETLRTRYRGQIEQLSQLVDAENITVSVIGTQDGQIVAWHTYGAIGKVLRDAGFRSPEIVDAIEGNERSFFSAEQLQAFDADFIITTHDIRSGTTPEDVIADFEAILPGFCDFLHACRNGQFIMLPREDAVTRSYTALGLMTSAVTTAIAGRPYVPMER
jgi:iron complex transport system substrate-binding protein